MGQNKFREDNNNFFWDRFNNRLGIGTSSPTSILDVFGNTSISGNLDVIDSEIFINIGAEDNTATIHEVDVATANTRESDLLLSSSNGNETVQLEK